MRFEVFKAFWENNDHLRPMAINSSISKLFDAYDAAVDGQEMRRLYFELESAVGTT
jgi:hypothetical protein